MFRFRPYRFPRPKGPGLRFFPRYVGQSTASYVADFNSLNHLKGE